MNASKDITVGLHDARFAPEGRTLVKQAIIVTGAGAGTFRGDLLLHNGLIAAVGQTVEASDAEVVDGRDYIVCAGFIDTHRHLWLSAFKGLSYDSHLADMFANLYAVYSPRFRPEDHYAITRLGRLAALDAGITTLLDWAHNIASPEDEDAAIQGLRDSGGRTVFGHGFASERVFDVPRFYDTPRTLEAAKRTRDRLPDDDALVSSCYLGLEAPALISMDACRKEFEIARELGMRISVHITSMDEAWRPFATLEAMHAAGLMGDDVTWVHLARANDHELKLIADTGGTASVAPQADSHFWSPPATGRLMLAGVRPSLSIDGANAASEDFFSQMQVCFEAERIITLSKFEPRPEQHQISIADVFEFATLQGARALGQDHRLGTVERGKVADLLFVDTKSLNMVPVHEPVAAMMFHASIADIDTVLVQGRPVKRAGRLLADIDKVRSDALQSIEHLFWTDEGALPATATRAHPATRPCACL